MSKNKHTKMNATIKAAWIARLNDQAEYQGTGYLNAHGCKCAFGVLCDIYQEAHRTNALWIKTRADVYAFGDEDNLTYPPTFLLDWAGLPSETTSARNHPVTIVMAKNDGLGEPKATFPEIASWIDSNL
jgi:hypothetical protein